MNIDPVTFKKIRFNRFIIGIPKRINFKQSSVDVWYKTMPTKLEKLLIVTGKCKVIRVINHRLVFTSTDLFATFLSELHAYTVHRITPLLGWPRIKVKPIHECDISHLSQTIPINSTVQMVWCLDRIHRNGGVMEWIPRVYNIRFLNS